MKFSKEMCECEDTKHSDRISRNSGFKERELAREREQKQKKNQKRTFSRDCFIRKSGLLF